MQSLNNPASQQYICYNERFYSKTVYAKRIITPANAVYTLICNPLWYSSLDIVSDGAVASLCRYQSNECMPDTAMHSYIPEIIYSIPE